MLSYVAADQWQHPELGILLEINASHVSMSCAQLREAAACGASFVIGSDAHTPDRVGDFAKAIRAAEEAGVTQRIVNASCGLETP